ncbi:hypothetical protein AY601_0865 [Pedobacter cryoconitis]|uniref:Uncharacterized protein n=1 Tax=Pedobacter cryoconitis TaxID=188932 RepID=A0A127V910_9SPHI|nr:hypothetical protein AY601_0865 [Pedobacter cryoconitis]
MARFWYIHDGIGNPLLSSSYNLLSIKPFCSTGCRICAIYAPGSGNPSSPLSNNIRTYIVNFSMGSALPQPFEPLGSKYYIYGKNC